MKFHYKAFTPDGAIVEGTIENKTTEGVLRFLNNKGLKPVEVKAISSVSQKKKKSFFGKKITIDDQVFITKYLSLMLKVGTDLFKAIDILIVDFDKAVVKGFMSEIRDSLQRGEPFHTTFAKYPNFFSPVFVNLIKAGESSGNLDVVLSDLNVSLQKQKDLRGRLRAALIYPAMLTGLAFVIVIFLVTFALPKVADVFSGGGFDPPLFSKVVFGIGLFFGKYVWIFVGGGGLLALTLIIFFSKTQTGRRMFHRLLSKTPIIGTVIRKIALQRFASTLSSLLKAGFPIVNSLEITASAVSQEEVTEALRRIAREGISKGLSVGESFKRETVFPAVITNLISVSENAGHIDEILGTLAVFYEAEIDSSVKTMVSFLEPVLLLSIGLIVGIIALSIIVPIYQLVGQF